MVDHFSYPIYAVTYLYDIMQANAKARFDETVEIAINLGTNPKRGDQAVRGTALLPFGTGKSIRIAAFAEGEDAIAATAAGTWCPFAIMPALQTRFALDQVCIRGTLDNSLIGCLMCTDPCRVQHDGCSVVMLSIILNGSVRKVTAAASTAHMWLVCFSRC